MSTMSLCRRVSVVLTAVLAIVVFLAAHQTQAGPVAKRDIGDLLDGKDKRPFCNAFTGCGKKRADPELEAVASGSELDALANHVLAEAKLWEQLQNKMEVMRTLAGRTDSRLLYRRKRSTAKQAVHHLTSSPKQKDTDMQ